MFLTIYPGDGGVATAMRAPLTITPFHPFHPF